MADIIKVSDLKKNYPDGTEAVKGVRVDTGFQGESGIMKASAKKHSLSGLEAMQIAESPKDLK